MFASILFPEKIEPLELDNFLANGWYRMGQGIFTTHFLYFKNNFYSAIWLRVCLNNAAPDPKFKQLQKQNKRFRTEIKKAAITLQHEDLYANYRKSISFEPSETLQTLLFGYVTANRFDSYQVNVYDGSTLIAAGIFDLGEQSAAGIVSFYHPAYKKYSLGKYLIYLKIDYCRSRNLQYFYPGYVAPGYPSFDYKLTIGRDTLEYFDLITQKWLLYSTNKEEATPLSLMYQKLNSLCRQLDEQKISTKLQYYRFFDTGLDPHYTLDGLLDFPVFLLATSAKNEEVFRIIIYDVCNASYRLAECSSVIQTDWFQSTDQLFTAHLLKVNQYIFSTKNPAAIQAVLKNFF